MPACSNLTPPRTARCPWMHGIRTVLDPPLRRGLRLGGQHQASGSREVAHAEDVAGPAGSRLQGAPYHCRADQVRHRPGHLQHTGRCLRLELHRQPSPEHFAYTSSGSAPARKAASGEVVIGLTFDSAIKKQIDAGQPIKMVLLELLPSVARVGGLVVGRAQSEGRQALHGLSCSARMGPRSSAPTAG